MLIINKEIVFCEVSHYIAAYTILEDFAYDRRRDIGLKFPKLLLLLPFS